MGRPPSLAGLVLLASVGCATPLVLDRIAHIDAQPMGVVVRYQAADEASAEVVERAMGGALARLAIWGSFDEPVEVDLVPTHAALEQVIHRSGYGWLRAWARYRDVIVQSPRTWSDAGGSPAQVQELLAHELTHCLMYQRAGSAADWSRKEIPTWFREGMASVTAQQGYRRASLEQVGEAAAAGLDPLGDAEKLYRDRSDLVYAAAHHAFEQLLERGGPDRVRRLLATLRGGQHFDEAFLAVYGVSRRGFEQQVLASAVERFQQRRSASAP